MTLRTPLGTPFRKPGPCSRAMRIRRELRAASSTSRRFTRSKTRLLQDILSLLQRKSSSLDVRLRSLQEVLGNLPPWTEWTSREDALVESSFHALDQEEEGPVYGMAEEHDVKKVGTPAARTTEDFLSRELIKFNDGDEYLDRNIFDVTREELEVAFYRWLYHTGDPENSRNHVKTEEGEWAPDGVLRHTLLSGGRLHIPTRTLREPSATDPDAPPPPQTPLRSRAVHGRGVSTPPRAHGMRLRSRSVRRPLQY